MWPRVLYTDVNADNDTNTDNDSNNNDDVAKLHWVGHWPNEPKKQRSSRQVSLQERRPEPGLFNNNTKHLISQGSKHLHVGRHYKQKYALPCDDDDISKSQNEIMVNTNGIPSQSKLEHKKQKNQLI